jgi:DNA-binding response OmpR family regulator
MNLHILIVDDENTVCDSLKEIFNHLGYSTEIVNNGSAGYHLLKTKKIDMIIMDIQMPIMTGPEAITAIREIDQAVYILAMSGKADSWEENLARDNGADGYVRKPFDIKQIEQHIDRCVLKKISLNVQAAILTIKNKNTSL